MLSVAVVDNPAVGGGFVSLRPSTESDGTVAAADGFIHLASGEGFQRPCGLLFGLRLAVGGLVDEGGEGGDAFHGEVNLRWRGGEWQGLGVRGLGLRQGFALCHRKGYGAGGGLPKGGGGLSEDRFVEDRPTVAGKTVTIVNDHKVTGQLRYGFTVCNHNSDIPFQLLYDGVIGREVEHLSDSSEDDGVFHGGKGMGDASHVC